MMIIRRNLIIGAGLCAAAPAFAQDPAQEGATPPEAAPELTPVAYGMVRVSLTTSEGVIIADLNEAKAPVTTKNFLRYVDSKRYDQATFYRASRPPNATTADYGVVQGGLENRNVYPPIAHEPTTQTGLKHIDGTLSMARNAPGTATSDFFICIGDSAYLDADPTKPGDNLGYAAFGQVVQGMDVVKKILLLPTDPNKGVGAMKGQILAKPLKITARRV